MSDDDIDRLTRQLENVRLQREQALQAVERVEESEKQLVERIMTARGITQNDSATLIGWVTSFVSSTPFETNTEQWV